MLKKIMTLILVISIFSVETQASAQQGLKVAFDELSYSLTVENPSDKEARNYHMKKFISSIRELQAKGLTSAQLLDFAKSEVKDQRVARDLETAFTMIQINKMSTEEANQYIVETMKKSYSAGASFNGEVFLYLGIGILIVAIAIAAANGNANVSVGGCYNSDVYVCDTYCYDDYWYGYSCYDDCYWTSYCY